MRARYWVLEVALAAIAERGATGVLSLADVSSIAWGQEHADDLH
jgi:hypothetical protein